jgi:hypothetical protein
MRPHGEQERERLTVYENLKQLDLHNPYHRKRSTAAAATLLASVFSV